MRLITISTKLRVMAAVTFIALISLTGINYVVTSTLRSTVEYVSTNALPSLEAISEFNNTFLKLRIAVLNFMLVKDPAVRKEKAATVERLKAELETSSRSCNTRSMGRMLKPPKRSTPSCRNISWLDLETERLKPLRLFLCTRYIR